MLRSRYLLAALLFMAASARAQVCTSQGLRTVEQAERATALGNKTAARSLLQRAYEECQISPIVLRKISDVYDALGEAGPAQVYRNQAKRIESPDLQFDQRPGSPTEPVGALEDNPYVREKWALVVGITHFKNPAMDLRFASKDATDFAAMLTDPNIGRFRNDPQHVKLLTDEKATVEGIRTAINEIARDSRKEDLVVMYFSSHGTSAGSDIAADEGKSGYIVTYNTEPQNLYATAFPMDELKHVVDTRIKAAGS